MADRDECIFQCTFDAEIEIMRAAVPSLSESPLTECRMTHKAFIPRPFSGKMPRPCVTPMDMVRRNYPQRALMQLCSNLHA